MSKFIGVKDGKIQVISDNKFINSELEILELPIDLINVSSDKLLSEYYVKDKSIIHKNEIKPAKKLKIAFVTNYGQKCGIATYSNFLYQELNQHLGGCKIFAESFENQPNDTESLIHCWKRGESLTELINAIKDYNPDVILIQHEWGLWHNSRQWISMMSQLSNYRIIVTMHSIFYHLDKIIVEASIPEMVVHLNGAKDVLTNYKKISGKIHVIPHGCFLPEKKEKLWNFYKTQHNFMQFGFLFKYKGFENSIKAVALLKQKYPDIYFTALCSDNQVATFEHQSYFDELIQMVNQLNIAENVGLIRGFQSDEVLDIFLRMNRAAVFPYVSHKEHECFGSSGATPYAMTKQLPIITSNIHHFENLPTIKAVSPEEIANELDKLFSNNKYCEEQIKKQNEYLEFNSWQNVSKMYLNILENSN